MKMTSQGNNLHLHGHGCHGHGLKSDSLELESRSKEVNCGGSNSPNHSNDRNHDPRSASQPQLSSSSQSRSLAKLIASASESNKEYLLQGGDEKEPISSDADADGVISNTDKDDEAEVIGCPEDDKNDDNNDRGRGFSSSNCDCDGDGSVRANCKFSLRECDFPDMTEDVTSAMSSDLHLQNLKRRLRQEQERNHQG